MIDWKLFYEAARKEFGNECKAILGLIESPEERYYGVKFLDNNLRGLDIFEMDGRIYVVWDKDFDDDLRVEILNIL